MNIRNNYIPRILHLPAQPEVSLFLWGPRQVGKSSLLKRVYPQSWHFDFLMTSEYLKYLRQPWLFREELLAKIDAGKLDARQPIVFDEVQRVPLLLDEVHWSIENTGARFVLCGSSARKLKQGHANLLGGRAVRYELHGLSARELGSHFNLEHMLNAGYFPRHYLNSRPRKMIQAYVEDYLKHEIADEALVRNVPAFAEFLTVAAIGDTEPVNYSNISRECGVSANTVKEYYQILKDTLVARFLPAYTKRPKRRTINSPKFYFADIGVVNHLAKRGSVSPGSELYGKAFENWVFHELNLYNSYGDKYWDLSYWRLTSGVEVDFVINDMEVLIEAKASRNVHGGHMKNLREAVKDFPTVQRRIIVSLVENDRRTEDGIDIWGADSFIRRLWSGQVG